MGRVVSFRFALVFGSMTIAMGVGCDPDRVRPGRDGDRRRSASSTLVAGLSGLFVPALRDA